MTAGAYAIADAGIMNLVTAEQPVSGILVTHDGLALAKNGRGVEIRGLTPDVQRELAAVLLALAEMREREAGMGHA